MEQERQASLAPRQTAQSNTKCITGANLIACQRFKSPIGQITNIESLLLFKLQTRSELSAPSTNSVSRHLCRALLLASGATHHGQGHDAPQVLQRQPDLRLRVLGCGAAPGVLHLPRDPAAASRVWEAVHLQVHLQDPEDAALRPAGEGNRRTGVRGQAGGGTGGRTRSIAKL